MSMKVFVILCSVLVIVGFCGSCYLMTTVNPEPIVTTDKSIGREREFVFDIEDMHGKDNFRDAEYGLEKAPPSSESVSPLPYLFRKHNPNWLSTQKVSNRKTVYPSNQLSLYGHLDPTRTNPMMALPPNTVQPYTCHHAFTSTQSQLTASRANNTGNSTDHVQISQPLKGRRRSIDSLQKRFDDITGSVLLKIVDEYGKSRIEIKVNTEDMTFRNKSSSIDNNSALTDDTQDLLISLDELPDRTEIRILPNSTLVVSDVSKEFDSKLDISTENSSPKAQTKQQNAKHTSKYVVKGHNDTLAVISRPGSNGPTAAMTVALSNTNDIQRTTKTVKQLLTGDLALEVLFDNVTRSFIRES